MTGTTRLTVSTVAMAAVVAVLALFPGGTSATGRVSAAPSPVAGVLGVDHIGITVPNVKQARDWFVNVMGCTAPLRFGPFADPKGQLMKQLVNVHPRAVIQQINLVRCGTGSSIELFQYTAPDQNRRFALNSDVAGHHVAFYVRDIKAAVAYMAKKGVTKYLGPFPVTGGPAAGQTINYFRTPFGLYVELISYPNGMAYEKTASTKLWNPADVGAKPVGRGVPGLLGVDHFGITVPNIKTAIAWFKNVLGCQVPLTFGPFLDPKGPLMKQLVNVHPRAVIKQISQVRCGQNGANLELFQYTAPGQNRSIPRNSDYAGNHIAFYVRDEKAAVHALAAKGVEKFLGPFPVAAGPAAGQTINYFLPPVGHYVEFISYPRGMAYEKSAHPPLWSPRRPRG